MLNFGGCIQLVFYSSPTYLDSLRFGTGELKGPCRTQLMDFFEKGWKVKTRNFSIKNCSSKEIIKIMFHSFINVIWLFEHFVEVHGWKQKAWTRDLVSLTDQRLETISAHLESGLRKKLQTLWRWTTFLFDPSWRMSNIQCSIISSTDSTCHFSVLQSTVLSIPTFQAHVFCSSTCKFSVISKGPPWRVGRSAMHVELPSWWAVPWQISK